MTAGFSGIMRVYNRVAPATLVPSRGQTPKGLASMPDHSIPATTKDTTEETIPYGYCQCGCGQRTRIARNTDTRRGVRKGEPNRFVDGHYARPPKNRIEVREGIAYFTQLSGKFTGVTFMVDEADLPLIERHSWFLGKQPRSFQVHNRKVGFLSRFLMAPAKDQIVDHINCDGLDNRRCNLRVCTKIQNCHNMRSSSLGPSRFKGVALRESGRWRAAITVNKRRYHLGRFDSEIEAAKAYDAAARELYGEFARLNFPNEGEQAA